jgi:hypothetical protein
LRFVALSVTGFGNFQKFGHWKEKAALARNCRRPGNCLARLRPRAPGSPILPVSTAVAVVALTAPHAAVATAAPGKRGESQAIAFPLLAVKADAPAGYNAHVSHS